MKPSWRKKALAAITGATLVAILSGCAPEASVPDSNKVHVVASTTAWGSLVEEIGGDWVEVTSIIDNENQDPHSHEASVKEQLLVSKADFVIYNGAGYDTFFEQLIGKAKLDNSQIIAAGSSGINTYSNGPLDPHSWYDTWSSKYAAAAILNKITSALEQLGAPDKAAKAVANNYKWVTDELDDIAEQIEKLHKENYKFLALETLGFNMAGGQFKSATPVELLNAAANEVDFSPALMLEVRKLLESGEIAFLVVNVQVESAQTDQIKTWAFENGVTMVKLSELKPKRFESYTEWMGTNVVNLQAAVLKSQGKDA